MCYPSILVRSDYNLVLDPEKSDLFVVVCCQGFMMRGARSSRRICLMIESTPPEGYEGNPRSQPTTLSGNGEVVQPDKTEANYCNATTSNKYSPNHTLSFQSTQPRTKLEARTGRRLNGCCCKSQSEFTLSQGKFTRAKEEVNSQTIFWLHLANLC